MVLSGELVNDWFSVDGGVEDGGVEGKEIFGVLFVQEKEILDIFPAVDD